MEKYEKIQFDLAKTNVSKIMNVITKFSYDSKPPIGKSKKVSNKVLGYICVNIGSLLHSSTRKSV